MDLMALSKDLQSMVEAFSHQIRLDGDEAFQLRENIRTRAISIALAIDGPEQTMKTICRGYNTCTSLKICLDIELARHVPVDGGRSLEELSESCGVDKRILRPVLRLLAQNGIFQQTDDGQWRHSALSKTMENPPFRSWMTSILQEKYSAVARLPSLLQETEHRFPSPGKTAYNTVYKTPLDFYSFSSKFNHDRALDYAVSMENLARAQLPLFERVYPLQRLEPTTHFVDVAGGLGYTSYFLAHKFAQASFNVQDYPFIVEMGQQKCPDTLKDRISFKAHDMFLPQPEIDRKIYPFLVFLLKIILHDHCDEECKAILKNLYSSMKKNDRILVIDTVIPEVGGSLSSSFSDIIQLGMFGSGHRTEREFVTLFHDCGVEVAVETFSGAAGEEFDGMMVFEVRLLI
ncbi:S-adenosyl-L-methionine-dependent methyltransferase [Ustulina deusta]|nr:S-adenosyl-L-methionine-dependent methyltransferase [Ustulina deusta]